MQSSTNTRRDSHNSETKTTNENIDEIQPPPYASAIYKIDNYSTGTYDGIPPPPSYTDLHNPSVLYINNYPGPPLTDGIVHIVTPNRIATNSNDPMINFLSTRLNSYFTINGVITILFGIIIIGLQIGLLISNSAGYYYYGFWAGALIIIIGISTIIFKGRYQTYELVKYLRSFIWQAIFTVVLFIFGIIIVSTDKCDSDTSQNGGNDSCKKVYKILNGFLLTIVALAFVQALINTIVFSILRRRYLANMNSVS